MKKYYKIIIFILIIIIIFLTMITFILLGTAKKYEGKNMALKYDNTWISMKEGLNKITLTHKTGGRLDINVSELDNEEVSQTIGEFALNVSSQIEDLGSSYKLIVKEKTKITNKGYLGYKMLYENEDAQCLVMVYRYDDNLVVITYTAKNESFDILLDGVNNMVYNLEMRRG